jgi:cysteine synthase A
LTIEKFPRICKNVTEAVGDTPLVDLRRMGKNQGIGQRILVKCEFMNPTGSMKDRMAIQIIIDAENQGRLKPGDTVIVLTSGNGGIAVAAMCAAKGYRTIVTMSEGNSVERRRIIKALGAELVLVPQVAGSIPGQVSHEDLQAVEEKTAVLTRELGAFRIDQFLDQSNPRGHEKTGHEIWEQTEGQITHFVAFVGSSGAFTGISRALKSYNKMIKCYCVEPASAPFLAGGKISNTSHKIQGGGYSQPLKLFDKGLCDGYVTVTDDESVRFSRLLAKLEGLFVGYSSGANIAAAVKVARTAMERATIATLLCDSGMRYLSTDLFE